MNGNRSNRALIRPFLTVASALSLTIAALLNTPSSSMMPAFAAQLKPTPVADHARIQLWPGACITANWTPVSSVMAVRSGNNSVAVDVAGSVELNAATAQYQLLNPGEAASEWLAVSAATTVVSSALRLRVDNVFPRAPINGALTTIQFRVAPSGASSYACSNAYSLFAASTFVYMPVVARGIVSNVIDLTTLTEPDNTVCQASYILQPAQTYVARMSDINDLYKIEVKQASTLYFTVTNFTQSGQVQLRSTVGADCNNTGALFNTTSYQSAAGATRSLVVPNVPVGFYYLRIVLSGAPTNADYLMEYSASTAPASPYEPNNTPCTAAPIIPGNQISAYPDDDNDWFVFDLQIRSNLQLVASHAQSNMQYLIYAGNVCGDITSNAQLITFDGGKTSVTLNVPNASIRKYFIRVAPTNNYRSSTDLYTFKVTTTSALAAQSERGETENAVTLPKDQTPLPLVVEPQEAPIP